jgi:hypothetical protein
VCCKTLEIPDIPLVKEHAHLSGSYDVIGAGDAPTTHNVELLSWAYFFYGTHCSST